MKTQLSAPLLLLFLLLFVACQSGSDSDTQAATPEETAEEWIADAEEASEEVAEEGMDTGEAPSLDNAEFMESESGITYFYANVNNLNLRDAPSTDGKIIHTLPEAAILQHAGGLSDHVNTITLRGVSYTEPWFKVMDPKTEKTGWVFGGAIVPEDRFFIVEKGGRYPNVQAAIDAVNDEFGPSFIKVREGEYISDREIDVDKDNLTIEGLGKVKIQCTSLDANVFWTTADNLTFRNLQASHVKPEPYASCVGNVFTLDIGQKVLIENCEINGCGRVGVYFNGGRTEVVLRNNWIHSNTLAAVIDADGRHIMEEPESHAYITFDGNTIEDNGSELEEEMGY